MSAPLFHIVSRETFILAPFGVAALLMLNAQGQMTLFSEGPGHFWFRLHRRGHRCAAHALCRGDQALFLCRSSAWCEYLGPTIQFVLALTVLHEQMRRR